MSDSFMKQLEKLLTNPEQVTPENMESLIQETIKILGELKGKIESTDPKEKEEARQFAADLKTKLEERALRMCESLGMDPEELKSYINTPVHFSPEEWQAMEKAKEELENYKEEVLKMQSNSSKSNKKKPKTVKNWLVS